MMSDKHDNVTRKIKFFIMKYGDVMQFNIHI